VNAFFLLRSIALWCTPYPSHVRSIHDIIVIMIATKVNGQVA
jgi:hypothetical protein